MSSPARDDIQTLRDAIEDALLVFVDTMWERAYRNETPAALSRLEDLRDALHSFTHWDFSAAPYLEDGQRAIPAEIIETLTEQVERARAALAACNETSRT